MLSRTWRTILLLIVLVLLIWPTLIGEASSWVALLAVVVLLIAEFTSCGCCGNCGTLKAPRRRAVRVRRRTTKRRRR